MDNTPTRFSALLWDVDGTLIDTTALIVEVLRETFLEFTGKTLPPAKLRTLIGTPLERQMYAMGDPAQYHTTWQDMSAAAVRRYERRRDQERIIPQAIEALIEGKRRGIPTALVTSKNDAEIAHTLPRLGISAYLDVVVTSDMVRPRMKPDPYAVLLALERLGVSADMRAIFIGDSVHDIKCGNAAGITTAAVTWGAASESALRAENPTITIRRPDELARALFDVELATAA